MEKNIGENNFLHFSIPKIKKNNGEKVKTGNFLHNWNGEKEWGKIINNGIKILMKMGKILSWIQVETEKDKRISLCSKMYCCADITEKDVKLSAKGIEKEGKEVNHKKIIDVLFNNHKDMVLNKGMRYIDGT
jgi:hypothetical protein